MHCLKSGLAETTLIHIGLSQSSRLLHNQCCQFSSILCQPAEPRMMKQAATAGCSWDAVPVSGGATLRSAPAADCPPGAQHAADTGPGPTPASSSTCTAEKASASPGHMERDSLGEVEASAGLWDRTRRGSTRTASPYRAAGGRHFRSAPLPPPINGGGRRVSFSRHPMKKDHSRWRRCRAAPSLMRARERRGWTNSPSYPDSSVGGARHPSANGANGAGRVALSRGAARRAAAGAAAIPSGSRRGCGSPCGR